MAEYNPFWQITGEQLGANLNQAREACGKSVKDCAHMLRIPVSRLRNYENGSLFPSLPELETLSYLFGVPFQILLGSEAVLTEYLHEPDENQLEQLHKLRQQDIATRFQIAREQGEVSLKDLAARCSVPVSRVKRYERGDSAIPLDELLKLAQGLALDPLQLLDQESPIGEWQTTQERLAAFQKFPEELQDLLLDPNYQATISLARRLQDIGLEKLVDLSNAIERLLDPEKS